MTAGAERADGNLQPGRRRSHHLHYKSEQKSISCLRFSESLHSATYLISFIDDERLNTATTEPISSRSRGGLSCLIITVDLWLRQNNLSILLRLWKKVDWARPSSLRRFSVKTGASKKDLPADFSGEPSKMGISSSAEGSRIRTGPVLLKLMLFVFRAYWTHTGHISWVISDPLAMSNHMDTVLAQAKQSSLTKVIYV